MEQTNKLEAALDELLAGKSTEEIIGPSGLLKQFTKARRWCINQGASFSGRVAR